MKLKTKRLRIAVLLTLPACIPLLFSSLASKPEDPNIIRLYGDSGQMKLEIERHIPIGTNIKRAKYLMSKNSFGCTILVNGTMKRKMTFEQARHERKTELACSRQTTFIVNNVWFIHFSFQADQVTSSSVYFRSTASDL